MITRRGFFGAVAALVVGSRVAPVKAAAPALPVIGGINPATYPFWRSQPFEHVTDAEWENIHRASMGKLFNRCRRDDGDTILELR